MSLITKLEQQFGEAVEVKEASTTNVVDEISPQAVAAPRTDEAAQELVKWCGSENVAFMARGGGTKLHIGATPAKYDLQISTEHLNQIVEHDSGNATVSAGSGISLATLNKTVAEQGQFVPLDDAFGGAEVLYDGATLGGAVATNDFGMSRLKYGAPRDLVVGLHAALSDGRYVKAGSKVVKNVSGYDLNKIFIGSFGTLGLITQVTVRLRPRDVAGETWQSTFNSWDEVQKAVRFILDGAFEPTALRIAATPNKFHLLTRFDGGEDSVQSQIERIGEELKRSDEEVATPMESALVLRAGLPLQSAFAWAQQAQAAGADRVLWDAGIGRVRVLFPALPDDVLATVSTLRTAAEKENGFVVVEEAPVEHKSPDFIWGAPRDDFGLMTRLKEAFDKAKVCAPGRFVGGL